MADDIQHTMPESGTVTFSLLIDGEVLSGAYGIVNIDVSKELNRIPTATVILLDGNPAEQNFEWSNRNELVPGNEIILKAGYNSDEVQIFKGMIVKHQLKIRSNQSYLILECKDETVKMTVGRKSKYFYDVTDSDVFEEILGSYEIQNEVERTETQFSELVQYRISDWDYMMTRLQANGKICLVDAGTVSIHRPKLDQDPILTVTYGKDLFGFDAEIDARNQLEKITSFAWQPSEQDVVAVEAERASMQLNGNLANNELSGAIRLENYELKSNVSNTASLQAWADAKALFQQIAEVRGRMQLSGNAAIKPDQIIQLEGVGDRFGGRVYISGLRHEIREGSWMTDVQFGIDSTWFSELYPISEVPASGLFPAVHGLQIGVVTRLEDDPEHEERILVNLPLVEKESKGIWARVATLDAGNERGSFFLPEIGDEVIVGFINDSPQDAVILGMLHSSAKPAPLSASDDNHQKGFFTRSGMKLLFDDDKKSVLLETPNGKKITLDEDAGYILIEDENGNVAQLKDDGISVESNGDIRLKAGGDLVLEGMNVSVKANVQLSAEGSGGAEVTSNGVTTIKGSVVQIN